MARYRMQDGTVINTEKAKHTWRDADDWDGRNRISRATGSQWHDQQLRVSKKGRYYLETLSRVQGQSDHCEWISEEEAVRWLLHNDHEVPEGLTHLVDQVEE